MNGAPSRPFSVPAPLGGLHGLPEWYMRARYSLDWAPCSLPPEHEHDVADEACCGLVRELAYPYALARGNQSDGFISCASNLVSSWPDGALLGAANNSRAMQRCRHLSERYAGNASGYDCVAMSQLAEPLANRKLANRAMDAQSPIAARWKVLRAGECAHLREHGSDEKACDICPCTCFGHVTP